MAGNKEEIQYVWKGNNKEAMNALAELESKNHDLGASIKDLKLQQEILRLQGKKNSAEYKTNAVEIARQTAEQKKLTLSIIEQRKEVGIAGQTYNQLKRDYNELNNSLKRLTDGSDAHNESLKKKLAIGKELSRRDAINNPSMGILDQLKGQMPSALAGGIAGGVVGLGIAGLSAIGSGLRSIIPPMKDLADANTDLAVALNLSDAELQNLNKDIKDIDTRTALKDLKEIGQVAGDLNVPTEQVVGFITEVDKGALVFKRSFASAEEYATEIGKLKGMFSEFRDANFGTSINQIGSAMKVLEDDGPATSKSILEFTKRIGQLPETLRPSISATMAYAAVLEEAGLTAEISSGGLSNILLVASKNSAAFAKQLGMTTAEFKTLINTDPNAMLIKLAESFKGLSNTNVGTVLKNLKLDSQESVKVLGTLADNTDKLAQKQILSNQALTEGSRITEIFNEKNNNFAGQIERIEKRMSAFLNVVLVPFRSILQDLIIGFGNLIGAFDDGIEPVYNRYVALNNQVKNYDKNLAPLLKKYDELKAKNLPESQDELRKVMNQIVAIMPEATSKIDEYGRTIEISTGKVRDLFAEQQKLNKELAGTVYKESTDSYVFQKKQIDAKIKQLQEAVMLGKKTVTQKDLKISARGQDVEEILTEIPVSEFQNQIAKLRVKNQENFNKAVKSRQTMLGIVPTEKTAKKPFGGDIDLNTDGKGGDKKLNDKLKKIQEEAQQLLDLQIDVAHQAYLQGLKDEEKKIASLELSAEKKLITLKNQFKNEHGLVIDESKWTEQQAKIYQLQKTQIVNETEEKITEIQREAAKKREQQLLDEQNRAIELANQTGIALAQAKVEAATRSGDDLAVYNAKFSLLSAQGAMEQAKLTEGYLKRQKDLEGNDKALLQLDKNYYAESKNITDKYIDAQGILFLNYYKEHQERKAKANVESLKLDAEEAKGKGFQAQYDAQLVLLNAEMAQELSVKNLTEQEKTNIVRKYAAERHNLELASIQAVSGKVVDYFGQAYSILTSFQQTKAQNESQAEDAQQKTRLDNLERQKERGQITAEQYTSRKTQLEAQHDKKVRQMQRKQAELNKQNQLVQATMGMAKAIIEVLATPWMIPLIAGLGLAQIGVIAAQEIPAYQFGGYTGQPEQKVASFKKPTATAQLAWLNEKGTEYVIPNDLLNTPAVANMVNIIEAMRTNRAYMAGGYTAADATGMPNFSSATSTATQQPIVVQLPEGLAEAAQAIAQLYKQGVPVYMGGADYRRFHEDYVDFQKSDLDSGI